MTSDDIRQEQYFVEERLRANKEFEEKVTLLANGNFSLSNIPIVESDDDQDDDNLVESDDLTITGGVTITNVNAETGMVETSGEVGDEVTVTYNAGEQFTITLDNAPVPGNGIYR